MTTATAREHAGTTTARRTIKTTLPPEYRSQEADASISDKPLATFLGLFSIGLGAWEALNPRGVAERTGVRLPALIRAYGLREIAAGVGILSSRCPASWLWGRVAGDVLDLATIGAAYAQAGGSDRRKTLEAAAAVAGVTALDLIAASRHNRHG